MPAPPPPADCPLRCEFERKLEMVFDSCEPKGACAPPSERFDVCGETGEPLRGCAGERGSSSADFSASLRRALSHSMVF